MRVISRAKLRRFWEARKADAQVAERAMAAWFKIAEGATWANWGELKQTFGSADRVGNCTVFDVGNNRFRVIGRIFFDKSRLYILDVMDHEEYDRRDRRGRQAWVERCGCHHPPPSSGPLKREAPGKTAPVRPPKGSEDR